MPVFLGPREQDFARERLGREDDFADQRLIGARDAQAT
jgi:hypothetical protein